MKKADLELLLKHTVCPKGCGAVEIRNYCGNLVCSECGEEFNHLTTEHYNYLLEVLMEDNE